MTCESSTWSHHTSRSNRVGCCFDPRSLTRTPDQVARAFQDMAHTVSTREQSMTQQMQGLHLEMDAMSQQIQALYVMIDEMKKARDVAEITQSESFQAVLKQARRFREKKDENR